MSVETADDRSATFTLRVVEDGGRIDSFIVAALADEMPAGRMPAFQCSDANACPRFKPFGVLPARRLGRSLVGKVLVGLVPVGRFVNGQEGQRDRIADDPSEV